MRSVSIVGLLALPLVALSLSSAAQNSAQKPDAFAWGQGVVPTPTVIVHSDGTRGMTACPLGMRARPGIGGQLLEARNGRPAKGPAARLHLTLYRWAGAEASEPEGQVSGIVAATVTVRGLNARTQIIPADSWVSGSGEKFPGEIRRTMTIRFSAPDEEGVSSDFVLPGFTATRLIELNSVTYADGSAKAFSSPYSCRVAPDLIMRVNSP